MKVLFITRKYPPQVGGMEKFSYNLINNMECNKTIIALKKKNINLIWFLPYISIYCMINAGKYDIIHLGDMVLSGLGWWIKLFYPNKVVISTIHGLDITYSLPFYQWYLKKFGHRCTKYICDSKNTEELAVKSGFKNTVTIPVGVEVNKFDFVTENKTEFKEKYLIPQNNIVLITTGRLVKRKGVLWFVENVMPKYKNKNVTYLIIGEGKDYNDIKSMISEKDLLNQVKMLGRVSDEELNYIYVNADIFVMPNIKVQDDVEGFGIVAIEAVLAKNIVIGSNIEGIRDAICNLKNGILVKSEDSNAYIKEINKVINNYENYEKFSEMARNFTIENYSWRHICNMYLSEFKKLL